MFICSPNKLLKHFSSKIILTRGGLSLKIPKMWNLKKNKKWWFFKKNFFFSYYVIFCVLNSNKIYHSNDFSHRVVRSVDYKNIWKNIFILWRKPCIIILIRNNLRVRNLKNWMPNTGFNFSPFLSFRVSQNMNLVILVPIISNHFDSLLLSWYN